MVRKRRKEEKETEEIYELINKGKKKKEKIEIIKPKVSLKSIINEVLLVIIFLLVGFTIQLILNQIVFRLFHFVSSIFLMVIISVSVPILMIFYKETRIAGILLLIYILYHLRYPFGLGTPPFF